MALLFEIDANFFAGQQKDERNNLSQIPDMFQKLVKEKGPWGAVTGVVGLLMRDEGGS